MREAPALVEIHYALWAVLSVPLGFAGLFFVLPGLMFVPGGILLAVAGLLIVYISRLTRHERVAWLLGTILHAVMVAGAAYYLPRWPVLLAAPLALANLYSLIVLVMYREIWSAAESRRGERAAAIYER